MKQKPQTSDEITVLVAVLLQGASAVRGQTGRECFGRGGVIFVEKCRRLGLILAGILRLLYHAIWLGSCAPQLSPFVGRLGKEAGEEVGGRLGRRAGGRWERGWGGG